MKHFLISLIIPLNLSITLFLIGLIFAVFKGKKVFYCLTVVSVLWTLMWSLPITSIVAGGYLENRFPWKPVEDVTSAEVIVVLGGNTANNRLNWFDETAEGKRHSRIDTATQLYFAGKAKRILLSGGALEGDVSEAKGMAYKLTRSGVPSSAIILEEKSGTTHENFKFSDEVLKKNDLKSIILVTSALHMPRAMSVFTSNKNLKIIPEPNPPQIVAPHDDPHFSPYLPNYRAYTASRSIIKEFIALVTYKVRGWI